MKYFAKYDAFEQWLVDHEGKNEPNVTMYYIHMIENKSSQGFVLIILIYQIINNVLACGFEVDQQSFI